MMRAYRYVGLAVRASGGQAHAYTYRGPLYCAGDCDYRIPAGEVFTIWPAKTGLPMCSGCEPFSLQGDMLGAPGSAPSKHRPTLATTTSYVDETGATHTKHECYQCHGSGQVRVQRRRGQGTDAARCPACSGAGYTWPVAEEITPR